VVYCPWMTSDEFPGDLLTASRGTPTSGTG
jgi:hypothetical protein